MVLKMPTLRKQLRVSESREREVTWSLANSLNLDASILKLYELRKWTEEVIMEARVLKDGELYATIREVEEKRTEIMRTGVKTFWDKLFDNELNILVKETVHHYEA